jgi:hypothetical protein
MRNEDEDGDDDDECLDSILDAENRVFDRPAITSQDKS